MVWKVACRDGALGENELKEFEVDDVTVLLTRVGEDYFAYPPLCPHQEEPLRKGLCDGEFITCFKHIWQWDLRTGACTGTESRIALKMYQVRKTAGQVEVFIDRHLVYDYET